MDRNAAKTFVDRAWEREIVPELVDYIRIPNKSPAFDKDWKRHGHMDRAARQIADWCKAQPIEGLQVELHELPGRTPLLFMEAPGTGDQHGDPDDCVLLYGHLDKQPEMVGWDPELGPWNPVRKGDKLYGRGGADDGYAAYAALTAMRLLQEQGRPRARCVVLIEACEESGSYDLPFYIDALKRRIGTPSLVIALDSGCGNYNQLWVTTSLRGVIGGELRVDVLGEGVHSGDASGIVPSSFRILRALLSRLDDEATGKVRPKGLHVPIPKQRKEQAQVAGEVLGDQLWQRFPWARGTRPMAEGRGELVLNRTWRPFFEIIGIDGVPSCESAGNVLRPFTTAKISLRVPPTADVKACNRLVKELLEQDPPHGAKVRFKSEKAATGWNAPALAPWLGDACERASQAYFGKQAVYMGEGGSIPFMGMLGEKFPEAQFLITGVLGPKSNAHGPNEFLHLTMGKRLTCCVAQVLADHVQRHEHAAGGRAKAGRAKTGRAKTGKAKAGARSGTRPVVVRAAGKPAGKAKAGKAGKPPARKAASARGR